MGHPLSPRSEKDGQEFGLVPRYVLRKKKAAKKREAKKVINSNNEKDPSQQSQNNENNTNNALSSIKETGNLPLMKDCEDEESIPRQPTPEEVDKLLYETNVLLARRWRLSSLIDSENDKKVFLATEGYHPSKAADRIEKNCQTKMELFGPELMDKKITLFEDLPSSKTEVSVEDGYVQLLPTRDLSGRAVLFFQYDQDLYASQSERFRKILFYMIASALEDRDTARKGISLVVWNGDPSKWFDPFWRVFEKISAPFKISKLHYCQVSQYESSYQVLEKRERGETDVRIHKGSLQECMHGLVTYGVPSHFIPLNALDGRIQCTDHLKWIELRRRIEAFPESQQSSIVLVPCQDDVLLGKRKMSMNGNVLYHQMIMKNLKAYHEATSEDVRDDILLTVWEAIVSKGGRFLLQVEGGQLWEQLELTSALYKIGQAFDFLCLQIYAPKLGSKDHGGKGANGRHNKNGSIRNSDDDFFFFGWSDLLDGKKCFDLIHCKGFGGGGRDGDSDSLSVACW